MNGQSAQYMFFTASVTCALWPMLTRARSTLSVADNCAGAWMVRSRVEAVTIAGRPPTVPEPPDVSSSGPAAVAVTWNV